MWQSVASQTTVGDGDATFSLQSTGRTVRSLSAGLLNIPSFVFYFIFVRVVCHRYYSLTKLMDAGLEGFDVQFIVKGVTFSGAAAGDIFLTLPVIYVIIH